MLHEYGHLLGAYLSGGSGYIKMWRHNYIPSMMTVPTGHINNTLFRIMGGITTAGIFGFLGLVSSSIYLSYPLMCVGSINFIYAFYETLLIDKLPLDKYMKWHYVLYLIVGIVVTGLFYAFGKFTG